MVQYPHIHALTDGAIITIYSSLTLDRGKKRRKKKRRSTSETSLNKDDCRQSSSSGMQKYLYKYSQTHTKTFVNDSVVIVLKFIDYHLCAATSLVFLSQIEENFEI